MNQPWHVVVLDEAQNIKNASTHAAQVVAELDTRHRRSALSAYTHGKPPWRVVELVPLPDARVFGQPGALQGGVFHPIEKSGDNKRWDQIASSCHAFHAASAQG
ncbi:MAG: hypothetical protein IPJ18_22700 [Betaproteobacteria bacterium]|nr:hypothetical protein [Betaproteobacteria bacterium]